MGESANESKVQMVCDRCGSEDVTRDSWASWDVDAQDWRLGALFAYAYCHSCQKDARIAERPIEE